MVSARTFTGFMIGAAIGALATATTTHTNVQHAQARGVMKGQCSVMRWYIETGALDALAVKTTRDAYPKLCKGEEALR